MPGVKFVKATRKQAKASILIEGLSGDGKSGLALALGACLANDDWNSVYAVDSENRSLNLYEGLTLHTGLRVDPFNVCELSTNDTGFKPSVYQAAQDLAIKYDGKVLINDSISHMWQAKGGILDMVSVATSAGMNNYTAWGSPEIVYEKNLIVNLMRSPNLHIINTVRVKDKMAISTDDTGKTVMKKMADQPIMLPQIEYEPDLVLLMKSPGNNAGEAPVVYIDKSRYAILKKGELYVMDLKQMVQIKQYLSEGVDPETLLAQQHADYVTAITEYLDTHTSAKSIWPMLKEKQGYKDAKVKDIPLGPLKALYTVLIAE